MASELFDFPNPVNEVSARLVAGGVVGMSVGYLITGWTPLLLLVAYGFTARLLTGPTLSPLGQLVTRVVTPRLGLEERLTAGPPKRFAQGIGATLSVGAVVALAAGRPGVSQVLIAMIVVAASLESFVGFCLGCVMFRWLMRLGVIPESVCADCADISVRLALAERDATERGAVGRSGTELPAANAVAG